MAKAKELNVAPPHDKERLDAYNRTVNAAELLTISLRSVDFKVDRNTPVPDEASHKFGFGGKVVEFAREENLGACFVAIEWSVSIKNGKKTYASCKAYYDAVYDELPSDVDDEIIKVFAENFVKPATYAYFRALFANLDWAAQLGTPPLPILKFMPNLKPLKKNSENLAPEALPASE
jgi:hypothetical protein